MSDRGRGDATLLRVPASLGLARPPRDPDLRRRWDELPLVDRERISRCARRGERAIHPDEAALVHAVAAAELERRVGPLVGTTLFALAVFFTVLGFARSLGDAELTLLLAPSAVAGVVAGAYVLRRHHARRRLLREAVTRNRET